MADKHLLFISRPTGYELSERQGDPPAPGEKVEIDGESMGFVVTKVAPSPLPDDDRVCAYLQTV